MRTTQDDARENQQIEIFDLKAFKGRSNKYTPDAELSCEGSKFEVELKTSDIKRKTISTARGVTLKKIDEWRNVPIWIFSQYEKPNKLTGEHYVLFPEQMEARYKKFEKQIRHGSKKLMGLNDWQEARKILVAENFDKSKLEKLDYNIEHKGVALNDPKIPWSYVVENGTKIKSGEELRLVVRQYYKKTSLENEG